MSMFRLCASAALFAAPAIFLACGSSSPSPAGPGPTLGDIKNCLNAITTSADVVAACLACAWLPGQVGRPPAREAIARLAGALGTRLTWPPGDMQAAPTA